MAKVYAAKDIERGNMSWLVYGPSRVGKTVFIGTFKGPICITNFPNENGALSLKGHSDVTIYEIEKAVDLTDFPDWVIKKNIQRVEEGLQPFGTVGVDSLTSWLELLQIELGHPLKIPSELPLIGKWSQDIASVIDRMRPINAEKVYTATLAINTNEVTGKNHGGPDLFKSLARRIPAKVDATIMMESNVTQDQDGAHTVKRVAWMAPHEDMPAGVRGYVGAPFIVQPTYSKIMAEMEKSLFD